MCKSFQRISLALTMNRLQWLVVGAAGLLAAVLLLAFDNTSVVARNANTSLLSSGPSLDVAPLMREAKAALTPAELVEIERLEALAQQEQGDDQLPWLKELSGRWYRLNEPYLAGYYAEMVAERQNDAESWAIAGTTYFAGANSLNEMIREQCLKKALEVTENAISLDPGESRHRVNLALVYTEIPPAGDPMKGIQMLLSMNEKDPDDVLVINTLGRLAMRTGQWERAKDRLEHAIELDPSNGNTVCLLSDVYAQLGDARHGEMRDKCIFLTSKN